jgi:hypothetical protein
LRSNFSGTHVVDRDFSLGVGDAQNFRVAPVKQDELLDGAAGVGVNDFGFKPHARLQLEIEVLSLARGDPHAAEVRAADPRLRNAHLINAGEEQ